MSAIKLKKFEKGFTLIEMSIALIVMGLILAPAITAYTLYEKDRKIRETETALVQANTGISAFREAYGRLPCPAPFDAVPGDVDYGYEDCSATAPGIITANNGGATPDVYIGSLPFRTMNLQERQTTDGYDNRLTYAVSAALTDVATYSGGGGAIQINDENGNSIIDGSGVSGQAHFIILSHGQYGAGAYSYFGVLNQTCSDAPLHDRENCDHTMPSPDATFVSANLSRDYDDRVVYSALNDVTPWQYENGDTRNIHLRVADFVVLGKDDPSSTPGAGTEALEVRDRGSGQSGDGDFFVENGSIFTDSICNEGGTNCFNPMLLAGELDTGTLSADLGITDALSLGMAAPVNTFGYTSNSGGMTCDDGSGTRRVMVGVNRSRPVCTSVLSFKCPPGLEMSSFSGGRLVCSDPGTACTNDEPAITSCGESVTITDDVLHGQYSLQYSGQCYFAEAWNPTASDLSSIANIQAYVDTLNNSPRTNASCGTGTTRQLVRDAYQCQDGSFVRSGEGGIARSEYAQELFVPGSWPSNFLSNSGNRRAEAINGSNHVDYDPAFPYTPSNANTVNSVSDHHDCWCREDYRVILGGCGSNLDGNTVTVQKHTCPATRQNWSNIYTNSTGFCSCSTTTWEDTIDCHDHFGVSASRVNGTVTNDYERTCSPTTVQITNSDLNCTCPSRSPQFRYSYCPPGTTNSFDYGGTSYVGVDMIEVRTWNCPTGMGGPVTDVSEVGGWGSYEVVSDENCVCDSSDTGVEHEACGPFQDGPGITWETQLNCATGEYERTGVQVGGFCNNCSWKKPGPTGNAESSPRGVPTTNPCTCGDTSSCRESLGENQYLVWDACQCTSD